MRVENQKQWEISKGRLILLPLFPIIFNLQIYLFFKLFVFLGEMFGGI